jgi:hypothetical protein
LFSSGGYRGKEDKDEENKKCKYQNIQWKSKMKKTDQSPAKQNVEVATPLGIVSFIASSSPDRIKK